jgi:hypothetical protein
VGSDLVEVLEIFGENGCAFLVATLSELFQLLHDFVLR